MSHEAGKGDTQRPTDFEKWDANFEKIFGKKSGITEEQFKNVDKDFAEEYERYKKDVGNS